MIEEYAEIEEVIKVVDYSENNQEKILKVAASGNHSALTVAAMMEKLAQLMDEEKEASLVKLAAEVCLLSIEIYNGVITINQKGEKGNRAYETDELVRSVVDYHFATREKVYSKQEISVNDEYILLLYGKMTLEIILERDYQETASLCLERINSNG